METPVKRKAVLKRIRADEPEWEWITHGGASYLWRPEDGALYTAEDLAPWGYKHQPSGITSGEKPPYLEEHVVTEREELNSGNAPTQEEIDAAEKAAKAKYWSDIMKKKKAKEAKANEKDAAALAKKMKTLNL